MKELAFLSFLLFWYLSHIGKQNSLHHVTNKPTENQVFLQTSQTKAKQIIYYLLPL